MRAVLITREFFWCSMALAVLLTAASCGGTSGGESSGDTVSLDSTPALPDGGAEPDVTRDVKPAPDVAQPDVPTGEDTPEPPADVPTCAEGATCDDGDPCTEGDMCDASGQCAGTPKVCDDGLACTEDACDATGSCTAALSAGSCLIDLVCVTDGTAAEGTPCLVCDRVTAADAWSPAADGAACDDGNAETTGDACRGGLCEGRPGDCPASENACVRNERDDTGTCVPVELEGPCNDANPCTTGDLCIDGACAGGAAVDCTDGNPCLTGTCDPTTGCATEPVVGPCDDGDACTEGDACVGGTCTAAGQRDCDDDNECTTDSCNWLLGCDHQPIESPCCAGGLPACDDGDACTTDGCAADGSCTHTAIVGPCDDGNSCTTGDTCSAEGECAGVPLDCEDDNECTTDSCDVYDGCVHLPADGGDCSDGDPCTASDICVADACVGTPRDCDDGVACTADSCDAVGECQHVMVDPGVACDDGNACTAGETCDAEGLCAGTPLVCDDGNPCTADVCDPLSGCTAPAAFEGEACDDGDECTIDDVCLAGVCAGSGHCQCVPELSSEASKVTNFAIGASGQPGNGLDVDANPATCAPVSNCTGGIDNSMSGLSSVANDPLQDALVSGSIIFLMEYLAPTFDGTPFTMALVMGAPVDPACDFQTTTCDYLVEPSSFDPDTCAPLITFDNARVDGTTFEAGGPGYSFPFELSFQGLALRIVIYNARVSGTVTRDGDSITGLTGLIGGAVPKQQLIDTVNAIPDDQFPPNFSKTLVLSLLNVLITNDIDTDGDGTKDAASIGILFQAIDGNLVGLVP